MRFQDTTVCLGYIHPHHGEWLAASTMMAVIEQHPGLHRLDLSSGPRIASARNQIARQFLAHPAQPEWLWMVDADMAVPVDTIDRLLTHADPVEAPLVGALCFIVGRTGILEPTLRRLHTDGGLVTIWDYPENQMVKVDATGTACLLVHRKVFEELEMVYGESVYPFFAETVHGDAEFGEDVTFCIRARKQGYPIWVHTGIEAGHIKPYVYTSADYKRNRREVRELGEAGFQARHLQKLGLAGVAAPQPSRRERRRLARHQ